MKKILLLLIAAITIGNIHAQRMDDVTVHSKYIQAVDEYRPAPGQYVNDVPEYEAGDTEADMIRKCNNNLAGLGPIDSHLVALGGWGGYIPDDESYGAQVFEVLGSGYKQGYAQKRIVDGLLGLIHDATH